MVQHWVIQDRLARAEPVDEADWDTLFATTAIRWLADDEATRTRIRDRMVIAFGADRAPLETELSAAEGEAATRWEHYRRMRDEREALGEFFDTLLASDVIDEALSGAQRHLPPGTIRPAEWAVPVHLTFFWPDAFADDGAIYLDLIHARDKGDDLALLLAHEFHHEAYAMLSPYERLAEEAEYHWVVRSLEKLHLEGLADRIDKGGYPLAAGNGWTPGYVEQYNAWYGDAPQTLALFDAALSRVADAEDRAAAAREAWDLLHLGAHPEGLFMADTIAAAQGADALLADVGDPFAFLRRFDSVRPTFSPETLAFLARVEAQLEASVTASAGH
jgi:hypothetical protein